MFVTVLDPSGRVHWTPTEWRPRGALASGTRSTITYHRCAHNSWSSVPDVRTLPGITSFFTGKRQRRLERRTGEDSAGFQGKGSLLLLFFVLVVDDAAVVFAVASGQRLFVVVYCADISRCFDWLLVLHLSQDEAELQRQLRIVRSEQMGPLSAASMESGAYQRGYEYIVRYANFHRFPVVAIRTYNLIRNNVLFDVTLNYKKPWWPTEEECERKPNTSPIIAVFGSSNNLSNIEVQHSGLSLQAPHAAWIGRERPDSV